tara:strand:+ start:385 stop:606 length:222 start_codon:yes stop_codon:yes gene_type:complete
MNHSSENTIIFLNCNNKILYNEILNLKKLIKQKEEIIKKNDEEIQDLCYHDYEREVVYGEKTRYCCKKCNHWY